MKRNELRHFSSSWKNSSLLTLAGPLRGKRNSWAILMGIPEGHSKWFVVKSCLYEIVEKWWRISLLQIPVHTGSLRPTLRGTKNLQGTRERALEPPACCARAQGVEGRGQLGALGTSVPLIVCALPTRDFVRVAPTASEWHQKHYIKQRVWGNCAVCSSAAWFWS